MLRSEPSARFDRGDDLYVRVHVLPGMCGDSAPRDLSELWRKFCEATGAAKGLAGEISGVADEGADGRMREAVNEKSQALRNLASARMREITASFTPCLRRLSVRDSK